MKLYSFDIFDTLLLRPYTNPQEVWKVLEEQEKAWGFASARKKADAETYQESIERNGETTIEAAYELIPQWHHMMPKEMEFERKILTVNPEVKSIWDKAGSEGKKRIIVSDMYLPSEFLKDVLTKNGISGWDAFYLSRDYNCRKSSGLLFKVMIKDQDVRPEDVLHIGDNLKSDVEVPETLGIRTMYYQKISDRFFELFPFARNIDKRLAGILALGWHKFSVETTSVTYWHRLGFVIGGILGYAYVSWIVETSKKMGINRLLFVARDGFIWQKICNVLSTEISTEYIFAPRSTSVAVNGATGNDPWAIKDREKYFNEHLKDADVNKIKIDYSKYIAKYAIGNQTAIVDGCSSGFSAQRLIEACSGKPVFAFYLLAMSKMHNAAALYRTNLYSLPFQMLSEFIFGAPTKPIVSIKGDQAIFTDNIGPEESFKISVSQEICDGAVACTKILAENNVSISAEDWLKISNEFMRNLTDEDKLELSKARNAADVQQKNFNGVFWSTDPKRIGLTRTGRLSFSLRLSNGSKIHIFNISRKGIEHIVKDHSVKLCQVEPALNGNY